MPIDAYTGWPGSGKSHTVVEYVILPALRALRCVVTNIPMKRDAIDAEFPGCDLRTFDGEKFEKLSRAVTFAKNDHQRIEAEAVLRRELDDSVPAGCVWVLDEVWRLWPAGQKSDKVPEPFKAILAEHRHRVDESQRSMQIALVSQDLNQIGKFARDLVEQTYRTEKLSVLGLAKRYRVDVYRGGITGAKPPASQLVRKTFGKYKPSVFKFYHSHTKREGVGEGADESKVDGRGLAWKSPVLWAGGPIAVVLLIGGSIGTWRFFHPQPATKNSAPGAVADPAARALPQRHRPGASTAWEIVASFEGGGVDSVYLQAGRRVVRLALTVYCSKDLEGFLVCEYDGNRISSRERILPALASSPSVASVLPFSSPGSSP